jgi:hypothetical protein
LEGKFARMGCQGTNSASESAIPCALTATPERLQCPGLTRNGQSDLAGADGFLNLSAFPLQATNGMDVIQAVTLAFSMRDAIPATNTVERLALSEFGVRRCWPMSVIRLGHRLSSQAYVLV